MSVHTFSNLSPAQKDLAYRNLADKARDLRISASVQMQRLRDEAKRRSLFKIKPFVYEFWPIVEPAFSLKWNWHLDHLCEYIEDSLRVQQKLVINVPPGTMKSLLMSVFARAWLWSLNPTLRFLTASYSHSLSVKHNLLLRDIVVSEKYRKLFPHVELSDYQNQKVRFNTTAGGWSIASSVDGAATGEHPDYILLDDILNAKGADSELERKTARDWIDRTLSLRGATRNARIWHISQRLHEQDTSAHLIAKGNYEVICYPMYYEAKHPNLCKRDIRTEENELLWPDLFDKDKLRAIEIDLGTYGVAGQLQQRPVPEGGSLFKREWFTQYVDQAPRSVRCRVRGWDTASTEGSGDYTVGVRLSEGVDGFFYIEHVVRGQWSPASVEQTMLATSQSDGRSVQIVEEREGGSSGAAIPIARARLLRGFRYTSKIVTQSKKMRASSRQDSFRAQCEAGNVKLVRGPWNEAYIEELCIFDRGKHDDQVDATTCAFNHIIDSLPTSGVPTSVGEGVSYWSDKST